MYFRQFEKGFYDLKGDGKKKLVTDLMTRVKVREKILDEASLYDKYEVPSGERPEHTAFKHFGSSQYHWVVLLTNNITDALYDWPLSEQDFETFMSITSDIKVSSKSAIKLVDLGLCIIKGSNVELSPCGRELLSNMKLRTKPMKKLKLSGSKAENLIDNMFAELK